MLENLYKEDFTNINRKYLKENFEKNEVFPVIPYALEDAKKGGPILESEEDGIYISRNTWTIAKNSFFNSEAKRGYNLSDWYKSIS